MVGGLSLPHGVDEHVDIRVAIAIGVDAVSLKLNLHQHDLFILSQRAMASSHRLFSVIVVIAVDDIVVIS